MTTASTAASAAPRSVVAATCAGGLHTSTRQTIPNRLAPKANGTPKRAKSAAARKIASLKRKHANNEGVNQPAIATETTASINRNDPNRCEKCRKHHQRCSGPTKDGSCKRCRAKKYKDCDLRTLAQDGTANKESSSELSTSLSGTSLSPEPTKFSSSSTGLFGNYSTPRDREFSPNSLLDGTSISGDCEASQSKSPQPAIRRKLVCRRNLPDYMFDE
ncbi:hypothetical protein V492_01575 [Pseudogymnoascus sp. VKM F-4246]|nr:hypothetical protein V492_01575 [Pseudogymnoascus sp. VKM F-4246]